MNAMGIISKVRKTWKDKGFRYIIRRAKEKVWNRLDFLEFYYYKLLRRTFTFQGNIYRCFYHKYNKTWANERNVEVPIFLEIVKNYREKCVLEVGNVLSRYKYVNHDVLDKYEIAEGVINQDVVDFNPKKKYDLIISISTLEHVGWDEPIKEPGKILHAIENLKSLLNSEGKLIVTLPLGYNPFLDELLKKGKIKFNQRYCMKRISHNRWVETHWEDIKNAKYGFPFKNVNGLVIGNIAE
jgi:hypothetical protein